ncbi:MAG TPA: sulfotransferase domain-containing protein [Balneolales bacterium]|nr:sulfotransferase domain-containing protein [Balneolales bacterium]
MALGSDGSENLKIVVAEFPKSGGSWLSSMLAKSLGIEVRDIYVNDNFNAFDISKHPWYQGSSSYGLTESCVIKSHEMPDSKLHKLDAQFIHMVRDGRDVVISKYFYEKDFCVKNGIINDFNYTLDEYIEKTAKEWVSYISEWERRKIITCYYENLLKDAFQELARVFFLLNISVAKEALEAAIDANSKEKFSKSLDKAFKHNTFVRKGIAGDWKNYFNEKHKAIFKQNAGELLIKLGYENDLEW